MAMTLGDIFKKLRAWWNGDDDPALFVGAADTVPDHQFKDLTRRLRERQEAARDELGERHLLHPSHAPKRRKPRKLGAPVKAKAKAKRSKVKGAGKGKGAQP
jgi:hypothetical protein